jgi:hypothetical protein
MKVKLVWQPYNLKSDYTRDCICQRGPKFADIAKIRRTKLATGEGRPKNKDEEEANKSDSTLDCI